MIAPWPFCAFCDGHRIFREEHGTRTKKHGISRDFGGWSPFLPGFRNR